MQGPVFQMKTYPYNIIRGISNFGALQVPRPHTLTGVPLPQRLPFKCKYNCKMKGAEIKVNSFMRNILLLLQFLDLSMPLVLMLSYTILVWQTFSSILPITSRMFYIPGFCSVLGSTVNSRRVVLALILSYRYSVRGIVSSFPSVRACSIASFLGLHYSIVGLSPFCA